jgi:hypothetical protein
MIAYKFLCTGSIGRFSGTPWPAAGQWLEAAGALDACVSGVHATSLDALSYWFEDELWTVELDGEILDLGTVLVARRGRLLERIEPWPRVSPELARDCATRARTLAERTPGNARVEALAAEAAEHAELATAPRHAVIAAYATAVAADVLEPGAFDSERLRQSRRIATILGLS